MFKKFRIALVLLLSLTVFSSVSAEDLILISANPDSAIVEFNVVHTNDIHGSVSDAGKFLNFATWYKTFKGNNPNTFLIDAGDSTQGTALVGASKGNLMVELMNSVGYDFVTLGNHEFDYGKEAIINNIKNWDATVLAANIKDRKTNKYLTDKWRIKEVDGVRIGFFGVANTDYINKVAEFKENYIIEDPIKVATKIVKELQAAKADVIICIAHVGTSDEGYDTAQALSREVKGINAIIDGHSHTNCPSAACSLNSGTALISSNEGQMGNGARYLQFSFNKTTKAVSLRPMQVGIAELKTYAVDPETSAIYNKAYEANKPYLEAVVGKSTILLDGSRNAPLNSVRTSETNFGNLITDAFKEAAGTDIALINGGNIRSTIKAGDITRNNILSVLPFSNSIVVTELTGKQILETFEFSLSKYPVENGGFLHLSGGSLKFDATKAVNSRITEFLIGGKAIDPAKKYTVALPDFIRNGGDGYTMLKGSFEIKSLQRIDAELLMDYFEKYKTVSPKVEGRIVEINVK